MPILQNLIVGFLVFLHRLLQLNAVDLDAEQRRSEVGCVVEHILILHFFTLQQPVVVWSTCQDCFTVPLTLQTLPEQVLEGNVEKLIKVLTEFFVLPSFEKGLHFRVAE